MFNFLNLKNKEPRINVILSAYDRPLVLEDQVNVIKAQNIPVQDIWLLYNKGKKSQIEHLKSPPQIKNHIH